MVATLRFALLGSDPSDVLLVGPLLGPANMSDNQLGSLYTHAPAQYRQRCIVGSAKDDPMPPLLGLSLRFDLTGHQDGTS